ncbi:hypothetical protein PIB30_091809 [Stylosanthes scabra]|uniref:Alkyl transferase n=1 Tax=Stylosanthes scabra TaxID=79078 RepID=A0ABU6SVW4_9FABA|nr:hypothetical protein [Stylosanthes scabra]
MINYAEESTKENSRLQLIVAVSYSGKYDVVQACKSVAKKVKDGILDLEEINEDIIEKELETNCTEFPNPDLLIRTSGELRVSNFLLWQLAYTELYFNRALWPDFGKEDPASINAQQSSAFDPSPLTLALPPRLSRCSDHAVPSILSLLCSRILPMVPLLLPQALSPLAFRQQAVVLLFREDL